jgi:hypothetical protein
MFDKNKFKEAFRSWVESNPRANQNDALAFCQAHIPANQIVSSHWLVDQSLQWFSWIKSRKTFEQDDFHDECSLNCETPSNPSGTLH